MPLSIPLSAASLAIASALICFGLSPAIAEERPSSNVRVVSSDASSRFVALAVNKSLVIELPAEASEVLIANPRIVTAVQRTKRRAFLIGTGAGQTNVFFYDHDGREIAALDVFVTSSSPPGSMNKLEAFKQVVVFRGALGSYTTQNCSHSACISPAESLPELPPGYTNISSNSIR